MTKRLVALYRSPSYSPLQHRTNDTAIMDVTLARLAERGWRAERATEREVEAGRVPAAELFVNMCQGPLASERLAPIEADGALIANRPTSVLACHRHRLVRRLAGEGRESSRWAAAGTAPRAAVPFPPTAIVHTAGEPPEDELAALVDGQQQVWIKRGDVHAERPEDVVSVPPAEVAAALRAFGARDIPWVAVQRHVPGPVIKFYGVADGSFFRWYGADAGPAAPPPAVDERRLRELAFAAAKLVDLDVFGGDVAVPDPAGPVLIDLNDWPSFAPFREEAAAAIAGYLDQKASQR